jgi:hypothetical protein
MNQNDTVKKSSARSVESWTKAMKLDLLKCVAESMARDFENNSYGIEDPLGPHFLKDGRGEVAYDPESNALRWIGPALDLPTPLAFHVGGIRKIEDGVWYFAGAYRVRQWLKEAPERRPEVIEGHMEKGTANLWGFLVRALNDERKVSGQERVAWIDQQLAPAWGVGAAMKSVIANARHADRFWIGTPKQEIGYWKGSLFRKVAAHTNFTAVDEKGETVMDFARRALNDPALLDLLESFAERQVLASTVKEPSISASQQKTKGRL